MISNQHRGQRQGAPGGGKGLVHRATLGPALAALVITCGGLAVAAAPATAATVAAQAPAPTAYVANAAGGTVTPIDTATNTAGKPIKVGNAPQIIAFAPDGKTAYVTNSKSGTVTPITIATNTAGTPIPVGSYPTDIVITP
jgi:YVTN family beta-propeller protein